MAHDAPPGLAARRWAEDLAAWAIPDEILARAPESPWSFPPSLFAHAAQEAVATGSPSPSGRRALEALPEGGSVLDVGVGGGAASLPLVPPAGRLIGVDESPAMLAAFAALAERMGVPAASVEGRWPDVAGAVGAADVAVCHHVLYNVGDVVPFVVALTARARRRVVVEMTVDHPQAALNPLWRRFHALERPIGPTVADAMSVLGELGLDVRMERWEAPLRWASAPRSELVAFVRRRLCLGADRDPEVDAALDEAFDPGPRELATLWWDGAG